MGLINVLYGQCDGCRDRVPAASIPDVWITVQHGQEPKELYCSPACFHDSADGLTHQQIMESRATRLSLTLQDVAVLDLLARGYDTDQIAAKLIMQPQTVKNITTAVNHILGVHDRLHAVLVAGYLGLIDLPAAGAQIRRERSRTRRERRKQQFFQADDGHTAGGPTDRSLHT